MHAVNRSRNTKGMLKMWRFAPNSGLLAKAGRSFAAQTREALNRVKYPQQHHQPSALTPRAH